MKARYNSLNDYLQRRFGRRVYKVTLESGCGCPNWDGTAGTAGCIFCNRQSYEPITGLSSPLDRLTIGEQLEAGISYVRKRHEGVNAFISYFQSGSNTYGPIDRLTRIYNDAVDHPAVVGLAISTRPDCLSPLILDAIAEIGRTTMVWIELGVQSADEAALTFLKRSHTVEQFAAAQAACGERGISVVAHVILGLPHDRPRATAHLLNDQRVWGVKVHNLHVLRNTELAALYKAGKVTLPTLQQYARMVGDFLEDLSPDIVVHRLNGHSPRSLTVAPAWSVNKLATFNAVEAELKRRDTWQGKKLS